MPPSNEGQDEKRNPVALEGVVLKATTAAASVVTLVFVVAWLVNLRADVNRIMVDITSVKQSVAAFGKITDLESKIETLKQFGSDSARKNERDITELQKKLELHEAVDERASRELKRLQ